MFNIAIRDLNLFYCAYILIDCLIKFVFEIGGAISVDQLIKSDLPLYTEATWMELINEQYRVRFTNMSHYDQENRLLNFSPGGAHFLPKYWIDIFLRNKTANGKTYSQYYYVLKEPLLGISTLTYLAKKNSPYRSIFPELSVRRLDFGLDLGFGQGFGKLQNAREPVVLSLDGNHKFCAVINFNITQGNFVIDEWLLKQYIRTAIEIYNDTSSLFSSSFDFIHAFVFLNHLEDILKICKIIFDGPKLGLESKKFHFLIKNAFHSTEIASLMKRLWEEYQILNFLIVVKHRQGYLEILSYNPFLRQVSNYTTLTMLDESALFVNKLKNLNGYQIRIKMFRMEGLVEMDGDSCSSGADCDTMKYFFQFLNASTKIIAFGKSISKKDYFEFAANDIASGKADILFNTLVAFPRLQKYTTLTFRQALIEFVLPKQTEHLLGLSTLSYLVRKNSPYRTVFPELIVRRLDFGLDLEFGKNFGKLQNTREPTVLTLFHFRWIFLLLVLENNKFMEYFLRLKIPDKKHHAIVNVNFATSNEFIDKLIAEKYLNGTFELYNDPIKSSKEDYQFANVFVFVKTLDNINNVTEIFLKNQMQGHGDRNFHYLVQNLLTNKTRSFKKFLKLFWIKHQILNYVLISRNLQIFSYQPYRDQIIKYTNKELTEGLLFPNKLRNLYGYKLKIQMFYVDDTLLPKENGDCSGVDCDTIKYIFKYLNASYDILPYENNVTFGHYFTAGIHNIKIERSDMLANSVTLFPEHLPYSTSPFRQMQMVIVLPKAPEIPIFGNIFHVYNTEIWVCWGFLKLLFSISFYLFKKYMHVNTYGVRIFLILYFLYSIEFTNSFQGSIITALTTPKYRKNIDTLEELIQSGIPIYSEHTFIKYMAEKYKKHFRMMHYNEEEDRLSNLTLDGAYLVPDYWVDLLMRKRTQDGKPYSEIYHVVKERVSGHGVVTFLVRNKSPYREIFRQLSVKRLDFGLDLNFGKTKPFFTKSKEATIITLEHIKGALMLLYFGLGYDTFLLEKNGDCSGIDCENMKYFFQYLNATYRKIPHAPNTLNRFDFEYAMDSLIADKTDILFNSLIVFPRYVPYCSFIYRQAHMEIVVPSAPAIPIFANIFQVYTKDIWFCWVFLKLIFSIFLYLFKKMIPFPRYGVHIILILYFVYTIEFTNSFQGFIITALTTPKYKKNIDTLDELMQNDIPIYTERSFLEYITESYRDHFYYMHHSEQEDNLRNLKFGAAYMVPEFWLNLLLKNKTRSGIYYSQYYHVVREKLSGAAPLTYLVRNKSPYRSVLGDLSVRRLDFGLDLEFGKTKPFIKKSKSPVILTLRHFWGAQILFEFGMGCALLIFILEILYSKYFVRN
ncbi:hypothetical protein GWI33_015856 [Rhynchophorus ferrugineus]|uniref:Ionotropic receptor n=2 Tax=Rhynchophorus ferrugineus TaxID=354439 RepID=A0A834ICB6_RHYFE|nr:hypothetical protein GWI33_015856 [Rhynchophorus ferrugineus]